jgi:hypothetical protein
MKDSLKISDLSNIYGIDDWSNQYKIDTENLALNDIKEILGKLVFSSNHILYDLIPERLRIKYK